MTQKTVWIDIATHTSGKLILASSKDLKGLLVHGRTHEEVKERIPAAIKSLLEAQGKVVTNVQEVDPEPTPNFARANTQFAAMLAA